MKTLSGNLLDWAMNFIIKLNNSFGLGEVAVHKSSINR